MTQRSKGRGVAANGRSLKPERFLRLDHSIFNSLAYRYLSLGARALLFEMIAIHDGSNNGHIGMGVRRAQSALGVGSKTTAAKYLNELEASGLASRYKKSAYSMKVPGERRATDWALEWIGVDGKLPTRKYLNTIERPVKSTIPKSDRKCPTS